MKSRVRLLVHVREDWRRNLLPVKPTCGIVWYFILLYDIVCYCMVLHCFACYWMVLYDIVLCGIACIEWYWMVDLPSSQSHRHLLQSSSSPHLGHHQDVQVLKDYFWQKSFRIRIFSFNRGLLAVALILVAIKAEDPDLSTNESLSFIHFDPFHPFRSTF